jgi:hypothetical protein
LSRCQIVNNHISRDVKGLFLGGVIVKLPMLQLEDKLLGKGGVMSGVKGLMGRVQWAGSVGPLGLGLGIRSSPYLGVK